MKNLYLLLITLIVNVSFSQEAISFYFDTNKFTLKGVELEKLNNWITVNKKSKILSISGSTDNVGASAYNDTLSKKRVQFVYNEIKGLVNIREDFKSLSLGEIGNSDKAEAENRKATIVFLQEKDLAKETEIIKAKAKVIKVEKPTKAIAYNDIIPIEEKDMNFPANSTLAQKIELSRPGTLILLKEVQFYKNTFGIIPTSQKQISELIEIMKSNPNLQIEFQGHICCVDKDYKNLSLDRSKQVRKVLIKNNVSESRMRVKGFGVTKPKFKIPETTDDQAKANRRVEIMILQK